MALEERREGSGQQRPAGCRRTWFRWRQSVPASCARPRHPSPWPARPLRLCCALARAQSGWADSSFNALYQDSAVGGLGGSGKALCYSLSPKVRASSARRGRPGGERVDGPAARMHDAPVLLGQPGTGLCSWRGPLIRTPTCLPAGAFSTFPLSQPPCRPHLYRWGQALCSACVRVACILPHSYPDPSPSPPSQAATPRPLLRAGRHLADGPTRRFLRPHPPRVLALHGHRPAGPQRHGRRHWRRLGRYRCLLVTPLERAWLHAELAAAACRPTPPCVGLQAVGQAAGPLP